MNVGYVQCIHYFFTCRISMHGRCHVLSPLNEFSGVALSCFYAFSPDWLNGSVTHTTGRLALTVVQGNNYCSFKVIGQETCQQAASFEVRALRTSVPI